MEKISAESLCRAYIAPDQRSRYHPQMGVYEVTNGITITSGIVIQNPLGLGRGSQLLIKDCNNNLKLIDKIELGK